MLEENVFSVAVFIELESTDKEQVRDLMLMSVK
jgi:hypothetical protein